MQNQGAYPKSKQVRCLGWTISVPNGCQRLSKIIKVDYVQTHWYTEPYSCTGGDYWNLGEGRFICPKCGAVNRLYERPLVERMKQSFKQIVDQYGDSSAIK